MEAHQTPPGSKAPDVWEAFSTGPGRQHETYEGRSRLLRELGILGWLRFHKAFEQALDPDRHPGEFEIHYIVNGELHWWVGEGTYRLTSGMVFVIQPDELHGSQTGVLEPCEHFWLRLAIPENSALPGLTKRQTRTLRKDLESLSPRVFPVSRSVPEAFTKLLSEHRQQVRHSALVARATLHVLLAELIREHHKYIERTYGHPSVVSGQIQRSLTAIQEALGEPPSVTALAKLASMGETTFRKQFRKEVGSSPHDYIQRRRIVEAKRLLLQPDKSIIDVAMELGFSSSQYFATVFKRKTGLSPKQFRKQNSAVQRR